MISILKITKGHHSVMQSDKALCFLYICTKFHENIFHSIKVIKCT